MGSWLQQKNVWYICASLLFLFLLPVTIANDPVLATFKGIPFCKVPTLPKRGPNGQFACAAHEMLYTIEVRELSCTQYITCYYEKSAKSMACKTWKHEYDSFISYKEMHCRQFLWYSFLFQKRNVSVRSKSKWQKLQGKQHFSTSIKNCKSEINQWRSGITNKSVPFFGKLQQRFQQLLPTQLDEIAIYFFLINVVFSIYQFLLVKTC